VRVSAGMNIRTFVAPGFGENCFLVWRDGRNEALVIDPGNAMAPLLRTLVEEQLSVSAILLTPAHLDHVEGLARLVRETGAPVHLHPADRFLYDHAADQARQFGIQLESPPAPDHELGHGQLLEIAGIGLEVRHAPGHSPGHVLFTVADEGCAFVGDVVFQGSIGRTDLPGGDYTQLIEAIREHVLTLPDDTVLYPGHGPATSVLHERTTNPFLIPHYGGGLA
jgi:hydroxyacylglutathione hydrolase